MQITYLKLDQIPWSPQPVLPRRRDHDVEKRIRRRFGTVPDLIGYLMPVPWVAESTMELFSYQPVKIPGKIAGLMTLVVTQENACRYCYGAVRTSMKLLGYSEEYVATLEQDFHLMSDLDAGGKAMLDFARKVARANPLPSVLDLRSLGAYGYPPSMLVELLYASAISSSFGSRLATPLAVPPAVLESRARRWYLKRFTRATVSRYQRNRTGISSSDSGARWDSVSASLPFAGFVRSVEAAPSAAGTLQRAIRQLWESSTTARRLKAFLFAVVGHALDCEPVRAEAIKFLCKEGFTEAESEGALESLGSDKLDPLETAAIRFARETVRYRPEQLQNKCMTFATLVKEEVLIEVLFIAAIANTLCRIAPLVQEERA